MRFKIDENLHPNVAELLVSTGHDAVTVRAQGLRGGADEVIAAVCRAEGRVLLTLDLDFSDIRTYPPADYPGIVILRVASQAKAPILSVVRRLIPSLTTDPVAGHLWIVSETEIRIRG